MKHDEPTQGDAGALLRQDEQQRVRRVEQPRLNVVNERPPGEFIGTPQRQFAVALIRTHQETADGNVFADDVGVVRVQNPARMHEQVGKEQQRE